MEARAERRKRRAMATTEATRKESGDPGLDLGLWVLLTAMGVAGWKV